MFFLVNRVQGEPTKIDKKEGYLNLPMYLLGFKLHLIIGNNKH